MEAQVLKTSVHKQERSFTFYSNASPNSLVKKAIFNIIRNFHEVNRKKKEICWLDTSLSYGSISQSLDVKVGNFYKMDTGILERIFVL